MDKENTACIIEKNVLLQTEMAESSVPRPGKAVGITGGRKDGPARHQELDSEQSAN